MWAPVRDKGREDYCFRNLGVHIELNRVTESLMDAVFKYHFASLDKTGFHTTKELCSLIIVAIFEAINTAW